ncbi:MAG: DUF1353 domain-containing protein [Helicobacteraceae bacterium]|nr:DUF1353 domain-containing protein [Helicobacteraceae bacterium]
MSYFAEDHVDLRLPKEGTIRTTLSELHYYSKPIDEMIIVPIGFKSDLGSIPSLLQWIFPKDGLAVLGYVLHDYLYSIRYKDDRSVCDNLLYEAMGVLGVSGWRRVGVLTGLKIGGIFAWNKHRKKDNK